MRIKLSAVPSGDIEVKLTDNGVTVEEAKTIHHDGKDGTASVPFHVRLETLGNHALQVKVRAVSREVREITQANNALATVVRVANDKARVLLIDGTMRWEYHYLANALGRDPTVKLDQVVFSQPRTGNLPEDKLAAVGHPQMALPRASPGKEDPLEVYDCIFLGDVPAAKLSLEERRRLERYVDQRGGTLVLLAGKHFFPMEYFDGPDAATDPLLKLLPISEARSWQPAGGFNLALTVDGKATAFLQLEPDQETNSKRFAEFPKHSWGLTGKPKPGATILAVSAAPEAQRPNAKSAAKDQAGFLVQQNYGLGRVLLVGIDSTWRWRYRVGDVYHHRFWGQVVRWAASDKLLPGGNRFVRFGSREPIVRHGQPAAITVRLGENVPLPKSGASMQVRLWRQSADGKETQAALAPLTGSQHGRLFEAQVRDLRAGDYRIEVDIPELHAELAVPPDPEEQKLVRRNWFTVLPETEGELFDLGTNESLLRSLAEVSHGRLFTPENVDVLLDLLARRVKQKKEHTEQRLWQDSPLVWWTLGVLLCLLSAEWIGRKWAGLP